MRDSRPAASAHVRRYTPCNRTTNANIQQLTNALTIMVRSSRVRGTVDYDLLQVHIDSFEESFSKMYIVLRNTVLVLIIEHITDTATVVNAG